MSYPRIYCPSIRREFFNELASSVSPVESVYIDGTNAPSYSSLINKVISTVSDDIVIISSDKARPTKSHVDYMLRLLESGFGFVGLYRLGFFGFHKHLVKLVGFFDERFITAGYEDNDYYIRLKMNNVGSYITEEIPYKTGISTLWEHHRSAEFFAKKYTIDHDNKLIVKHIKEQKYSYALSFVVNPPPYKPWHNSVLGPIPLVSYDAHFELVLKEYSIQEN